MFHLVKNSSVDDQRSFSRENQTTIIWKDSSIFWVKWNCPGSICIGDIGSGQKCLKGVIHSLSTDGKEVDAKIPKQRKQVFKTPCDLSVRLDVPCSVLDLVAQGTLDIKAQAQCEMHLQESRIGLDWKERNGVAISAHFHDSMKMKDF